MLGGGPAAPAAATDAHARGRYAQQGGYTLLATGHCVRIRASPGRRCRRRHDGGVADAVRGGRGAAAAGAADGGGRAGCERRSGRHRRARVSFPARAGLRVEWRALSRLCFVRRVCAVVAPRSVR